MGAYPQEIAHCGGYYGRHQSDHGVQECVGKFQNSALVSLTDVHIPMYYFTNIGIENIRRKKS